MALEQFQTEENIPAEVPAEVPAETPVVKTQLSKEEDLANEQTMRLRQKRLEYDQQIQKLIDKFSNRRLPYNPQLLALGAGLLTPGKTGNFFEGLGLGTKGYLEAGEKMQEQDIQNAKLESELRAGQIGQIKEDIALQRQLMGDKMLKEIIARNRNRLPTTNINLTDYISGVESGEIILNPTDIAIVGRYDKDLGALLDKAYDNQQKAKELGQKEFSSAPRLFRGEEVKLNVEQARKLQTLENETLRLVEEGKITDQDRTNIIDQFLIKQNIVKPVAPKEGEIPSKTALGTTKQAFETPADIATKKEIEKVQSTEDIKTAKEVQKKDLGEITKVTDAARTQLVSGNEMFKYADDPKMKQIFGILQKGGYLNAFLTALREPITIVTPSGPLSIGVGNIEEILRVANVKDPALLETAQKFKSLSKQVETNMTRILLGGEGQITEGERAIVRDIVPTLSDSPKVVQAKAELLIARSQFDIERAKAFEAYIRKNKNATRFEFENNPDSPYQKLWYDYQKHTAEISDAYRTDGKKTPIGVVGETKSTKPSRSSLWDALKQQQENQ